MNNQTFSIAAIANVAGKCKNTIYFRARALGINNREGRYTANQAHSLIHYERKKHVHKKETLEQETERLIKAMTKINTRRGVQTVISA